MYGDNNVVKVNEIGLVGERVTYIGLVECKSSIVACIYCVSKTTHILRTKSVEKLWG